MTIVNSDVSLVHGSSQYSADAEINSEKGMYVHDLIHVYLTILCVPYLKLEISFIEIVDNIYGIAKTFMVSPKYLLYLRRFKIYKKDELYYL